MTHQPTPPSPRSGKHIDVDVMIGDKFFHTFRVSMLIAEGIADDGKPIVDYERLCRHIEGRMPTLKGKRYKIYA